MSISLTLNLKLIEQLKVYYTKWKQLSHIKETLSLSAEVRKPLSLIIHDPLRSTKAPAIPQNQLTLHHATKGFLDMPSQSTPGPSNRVESESITESAQAIPSPNMSMEVDFHPVSESPDPPPSAIPSHDNRKRIELLARQRVADSVARVKPTKVLRKRRTCRKCAMFGCPGSQKVSNCRNPCQDCNLVNCRGRNPKRLDRTCMHGWD